LFQLNDFYPEGYPGFKIVLGYFACLVHRRGIRPQVYYPGAVFQGRRLLVQVF
jgi:hypothetical protein